MKLCSCRLLMALLLASGPWASAKALPIATEEATSADSAATAATQTAPTSYEKRIARYEHFWQQLIPNQLKTQYAGSIGLVAVGAGWHYGHERRTWETDLYLGYLPKFDSRTARTTFTVKQSYVPFRKRLGDNIDIEPLACGMFINTIFGEEFWGAQPSKYPRKYYGFSTKFRANIFVGQRLRFAIPSSKRKRYQSISTYYELSTSELYLASYFTNSYLSLWDILSLSLGLKFDLF